MSAAPAVHARRRPTPAPTAPSDGLRPSVLQVSMSQSSVLASVTKPSTDASTPSSMLCSSLLAASNGVSARLLAGELPLDWLPPAPSLCPRVSFSAVGRCGGGLVGASSAQPAFDQVPSAAGAVTGGPAHFEAAADEGDFERRFRCFLPDWFCSPETAAGGAADTEGWNETLRARSRAPLNVRPQLQPPPLPPSPPPPLSRDQLREQLRMSALSGVEWSPPASSADDSLQREKLRISALSGLWRAPPASSADDSLAPLARLQLRTSALRDLRRGRPPSLYSLPGEDSLQRDQLRMIWLPLRTSALIDLRRRPPMASSLFSLLREKVRARAAPKIPLRLLLRVCKVGSCDGGGAFRLSNAGTSHALAITDAARPDSDRAAAASHSARCCARRDRCIRLAS